MHTHIALLRGINVSGQKKIKMAELRTSMEELGFGQVRTYIQSGNILLQSEKAADEVEELIGGKIKAEYGFEVPVMVKSPGELKAAIEGNPFVKDPEKDVKRFYLTFLAETPAEDRIEQLKSYDFSPEEFLIDGKVVHFYSPNDYGRAKMNNNFFEQKLKVRATTRNWRTTLKLIEMSEEG